MGKNIVLLLFVATALTMLAVPAYADLVPMSWGFPTWVQNSSLLNVANSVAWQNNFDFTNISFPTGGSDSMTGIGITSFPTIMQNQGSTSFMSSFSFSHQTDSSVFTYPWVSIGFSPVPSMGFL